MASSRCCVSPASPWGNLKRGHYGVVRRGIAIDRVGERVALFTKRIQMLGNLSKCPACDFFCGKVRPPFVLAKRPMRWQTRKRCPRQVSRLVGRRHRETSCQLCQISALFTLYRRAGQRRGQFIFEHLCRRKVLQLAENSRPPSQSLFSAPIRRFRFPRASRHGVPLSRFTISYTRCIGVCS